MKWFKTVILTFLLFFGVFFVFKKIVGSEFVANKIVQLLNDKVFKRKETINFSQIELSYFPLGTNIKNINLKLDDISTESIDIEIQFFLRDLFKSRLNVSDIIIKKGIVQVQNEKKESTKSDEVDIYKNIENIFFHIIDLR